MSFGVDIIAGAEARGGKAAYSMASQRAISAMGVIAQRSPFIPHTIHIVIPAPAGTHDSAQFAFVGDTGARQRASQNAYSTPTFGSATRAPAKLSTGPLNAAAPLRGPASRARTLIRFDFRKARGTT